MQPLVQPTAPARGRSLEPHGSESALARVVAPLPPGYFALVMATGIVAIDLHVAHHGAVSMALTVIAAAAFAVLVALSALRLVRFGHRMRDDARNPASTFTFLTFVAGSVVLARQPPFAVHDAVLISLGGVAFAAWLVLLPMAVRCALRRPVRELHVVAVGNWLLAVVSTQALAIDASTLAQSTGHRWLATVGFAGWALGCVLYALVIIPVAGRLVLAVRRAQLESFTPDFWITMGALAITTLSTAFLLTSMVELGVLASATELVRVAGMVVWITATVWIAPLILLEAMKARRVGLPAYHVARWSTVFPLGMYAAGSTALARHISWAAMRDCGQLFTWLGLAAWTLTAWGLARRIASNGDARPSTS